MGLMTAATMTALAKTKPSTSNGSNATTKFGNQQRLSQRTRPPPPVKPEPMLKPEPALEAGGYTDYELFSHVEDSYTYNTLRLKPNNPVPVLLESFRPPVKLNRKNAKFKGPGGEGIVAGTSREPKWKPMKGPDGKEVVGKDGKTVMVGMVDGKEVLQANWGKEETPKGKPGADGKKKNPFQAKTKQTHLLPDHIRQLRREEVVPWLLEDSANQSWTGKMTDQNADGLYGLFVANPTNGGFTFIPVNRCYDFVPSKTHVASMTSDEAEAEFAKSIKNSSLALQFTRRGAPSAATLATISAGENLANVAAAGGVKKEEGGDDLFGDDEVKKERGEEGHYDELDFDEEHADDDQAMEPAEMEDEETREINARIKMEQIAANKTVDSRVDDSDDDLFEELTKEGKKMKRALKKNDEETYDSDEDANPYITSEEEEDDEPEVPAVQAPTSTPGSKSNTPKPRAGPVSKTPKDGSRAASPALSGAALIAKRATSPSRKNGTSRAGSPLVSRGASPLASGSGSLPGSSSAVARAGSGPLSTAGKGKGRASSPSTPHKRKAGDEAASPTPTGTPSGAPKAKKAKSVVKMLEEFEGMLPESDVVEYLRAHPGVLSSVCVAHFKKKKWFTNPKNKERLATLVRTLATTESKPDGYHLTLKDEY